MTTKPSSDVIDLQIDAGIGHLTLNRPAKLNAMNPPMWDDLPRAMTALGEDDAVRVVVISGAGTSFTVGIDLVEFAPLLVGDHSSVAARRQTYASIARLQRTFTAIAECPKPVVAAVHGYCLGAGVDLITACDIRLAAADAVFSVRETQIGMVADVGTLQRLPHIVGAGAVADLVFTGRDVDADEAKDMGLVSRVFADADELRRGTHEIAAQIAANSPLAVQGSKAVLKAGRPSVDSALDYVALWNAAFLHSNDFHEGVTAFTEKRKPDFTGT